MTEKQVDVKVQVRAIMARQKKDPLEVAFRYPLPPPVEIDPQKLDPDYFTVQLLFQGEKNRDFVLNMVLSQELAKQMSLMVGDKLTLKLINESQ